jgi:hypothetical protein
MLVLSMYVCVYVHTDVCTLKAPSLCVEAQKPMCCQCVFVCSGCVHIESPSLCVEAPQKPMCCLCVCVCVYVHTNECALKAQASALRHHKNLQVHVSHASTLESKQYAAGEFWVGLGLITIQASIGP